jgi:predicted transcriptional regulator
VTVRNRRLADGELEALVLDALWSADEWLMPGDVLERLRPKHPLAYTSVMTVLVRLRNKGMVERRPQGRGFAYRPVQTREELVADRMRELLETSEDHGAALAHFLDGMGTGDRRRLRSLLNHGRRKA